MIDEQLISRGIKDKKVLKALYKIKRHLFVPDNLKTMAYADHPLPIGYGQTISQPYIVAIMTELLKLDATKKILEIGTGSGYQAAVLAEIAKEVYTIEIIKPLAENAKSLLKKLGYKNIYSKFGNGYKGWPEKAPFDAVIVTGAPSEIPEALIKQLKVRGKMIIPVGEKNQELLLLVKQDNGKLKKKKIFDVRFVPMTGKMK